MQQQREQEAQLLQRKRETVIQGHPRSSIVVPIDVQYEVSK